MSKKTLYRLKDGSWNVKVTSDGLDDDIRDIVTDRTYEILAKNCRLPDADGGRKNDTIIRNVNSDDIYFIQRTYLEPLNNYCPNCGTKLKK